MPPLSDPRVTMLPNITARSRNALQKQIEAVRWLLKAKLKGKNQDALDHLIEGIQEVIELAPKIEDAVYFAVDAGWSYGAKRGISEQNTQNILIRHQPSNKAKEKLLALWITGKWKTKVSCVIDNYETLLREVGLWKVDADKRVPSEQTLIRWLQKQ